MTSNHYKLTLIKQEDLLFEADMSLYRIKMIIDYYKKFLQSINDKNEMLEKALRKKIELHSKSVADDVFKLDFVEEKDAIQKRLEELLEKFQNYKNIVSKNHNIQYKKNFKKSLNQIFCNRVYHDMASYDKVEISLLYSTRKCNKAGIIKRYFNRFTTGDIHKGELYDFLKPFKFAYKLSDNDLLSKFNYRPEYLKRLNRDDEKKIFPEFVVSMKKPSLVKIAYCLILLQIESYYEEDEVIAKTISDLFEKLFAKIFKISKADLYDVERYVNVNLVIAKKSMEVIRNYKNELQNIKNKINIAHHNRKDQINTQQNPEKKYSSTISENYERKNSIFEEDDQNDNSKEYEKDTRNRNYEEIDQYQQEAEFVLDWISEENQVPDLKKLWSVDPTKLENMHISTGRMSRVFIWFINLYQRLEITWEICELCGRNNPEVDF